MANTGPQFSAMGGSTFTSSRDTGGAFDGRSQPAAAATVAITNRITSAAVRRRGRPLPGDPAIGST